MIQSKLSEGDVCERKKAQLKEWSGSETDCASAKMREPEKIKFPLSVQLLAACSNSDLEEFSRLLKLGTDINTQNADGLTSAHLACINVDFDFLKFLISHGANINMQDHEGWTPLHAASSVGCCELARFLIENGADISILSVDLELALDVAHDSEMKNFLRSAMEKQGLDPDQIKQSEEQILLNDANYWCNTGDYTSVIDPRTGATPLHVAACKDYIDALKILLKVPNMDINAKDFDGWTPLHAAAHWNREESARLLAEAGASFDEYTSANQSVFDVADKDMIVLLRQLRDRQRAERRSVANKKTEPPKPTEAVKRSHGTNLEIDTQPNIRTEQLDSDHALTNKKPTTESDISVAAGDIDSNIVNKSSSPDNFVSNETENSVNSIIDIQPIKSSKSGSSPIPNGDFSLTSNTLPQLKIDTHVTKTSTTLTTTTTTTHEATTAISTIVGSTEITTKTTADSSETQLSSDGRRNSPIANDIKLEKSILNKQTDKEPLSEPLKIYKSPLQDEHQHNFNEIVHPRIRSRTVTVNSNFNKSPSPSSSSTSSGTDQERKEKSPPNGDHKLPNQRIINKIIPIKTRSKDSITNNHGRNFFKTNDSDQDSSFILPTNTNSHDNIISTDKLSSPTRSNYNNSITSSSTTTTPTISTSSDETISSNRRISVVMAPTKSDETETQRSVKARYVRSTRRSTQGVSLEDFEEAKKLVNKNNSAIYSSNKLSDSVDFTKSNLVSDKYANNNTTSSTNNTTTNQNYSNNDDDDIVSRTTSTTNTTITNTRPIKICHTASRILSSPNRTRLNSSEDNELDKARNNGNDISKRDRSDIKDSSLPNHFFSSNRVVNFAPTDQISKDEGRISGIGKDSITSSRPFITTHVRTTTEPGSTTGFPGSVTERRERRQLREKNPPDRILPSSLYSTYSDTDRRQLDSNSTQLPSTTTSTNLTSGGGSVKSYYNDNYESKNIVQRSADYKRLYEEEKLIREKLERDLDKLKHEIVQLRNQLIQSTSRPVAKDFYNSHKNYDSNNNPTNNNTSVTNTTTTTTSVINNNNHGNKSSPDNLHTQLLYHEDRLKELNGLQEEIFRLKEENGALIRVISKLSRPH